MRHEKGEWSGLGRASQRSKVWSVVYGLYETGLETFIPNPDVAYYQAEVCRKKEGGRGAGRHGERLSRAPSQARGTSDPSNRRAARRCWQEEDARQDTGRQEGPEGTQELPRTGDLG